MQPSLLCARLALSAAACSVLPAGAVIVAGNSDANTAWFLGRVCHTAEAAAPNASTLCTRTSFAQGSSALTDAQTVASLGTLWRDSSDTGQAAPLNADEAQRLRSLPDLSSYLSGSFLVGERQFSGTWQRSFSGPLLLQFAEKQNLQFGTDRNVFYYYLPQVHAQAGDVFVFAPNFREANPLAWLDAYTIAPIPEPGTWALMALGLAALRFRTNASRKAIS
jgi:hypothetical protein